MAKFPHAGGRFRGRRRHQRKPYLRKNERIRSREVRVIGPDAKQIGILQTSEALKLARQVGLDLVEISPTARPPVCRILDFGKYKYEQSKKGRENKKHPTSKIKEVKFRVRIEQHDYMVKLRRAEDFLDKGNKVKLTLSFRGRELEHTELGFDVINRAVKDLTHIGSGEAEPKMAGRNIILLVSPLPVARRTLKYNERQEE